VKKKNLSKNVHPVGAKNIPNNLFSNQTTKPCFAPETVDYGWCSKKHVAGDRTIEKVHFNVHCGVGKA